MGLNTDVFIAILDIEWAFLAWSFWYRHGATVTILISLLLEIPRALTRILQQSLLSKCLHARGPMCLIECLEDNVLAEDVGRMEGERRERM